MHYFNIDGNNPQSVSGMVLLIMDLMQKRGKRVCYLSDVGVGESAVLTDRDLWTAVTHPDKSNEEKIKALVKARHRFYVETLLPALGNYDVVLLHGGLLHDMRWMDYRQDCFNTVLEENFEMWQSLGGVAYPAGYINVRTPDEPLNSVESHNLNIRSHLLGESMSRFKVVDYLFTTEGDHDVSMLLTP